MRNYIRKTNRSSWDKADMQRAIEDVVKKRRTVASACQFYSVPRGTLRHKVRLYRLNKDSMNIEDLTTKRTLAGFRQAFTDEEENVFLKYLTDMEEKLYILTRTDVRKLAFQFAERYKSKHPFNKKLGLAGQDWLTNFIKRHPQLHIKRTERLSAGEPHELNEEAVLEFFAALNWAMKKYNFPPARIYNADEIDITLLSHETPKITPAQASSRPSDVLGSDDKGDNVSIQICFSAGGVYMPMMLVFPSEEADEAFLQGAPIGTWAECHPSGRFQHDTFFRWMKKFIEFSGASKDEPVLLILNAHLSYIKCLDIIDLAHENGVIIICLSALLKHELQPIEVAFSKPFNDFYISEVRQWLAANSPKYITIYQIAELLGNAYLKTIELDAAVSGFNKTGIFPFNTHFMEEELTNKCKINDQAESLQQLIEMINVSETMVNGSQEETTPKSARETRSSNRPKDSPSKKCQEEAKRPLRKRRKVFEESDESTDFVDTAPLAADDQSSDEEEEEAASGTVSLPFSIKIKNQPESVRISRKHYNLKDGQLYLLKNNRLIPVALEVVCKEIK